MIHVPLFLSNVDLSIQIYHYSHLSSVASAKKAKERLFFQRRLSVHRRVRVSLVPCHFRGGVSGEG